MSQPYDTGITPQKIRFSVKNCSSDLTPNQPAGAIGAIEKISDIEAFGSATEALDVLHKTVRAGGPAVERIINGGVNKVVDTIARTAGIDGGAETVFGAINKINPDVVNRTVGAAERILDRIENDEFELDDIPIYTRDFANLIKLSGKILTRDNTLDQSGREVCQAPNYSQQRLYNMGVKLNHRFLVNFNVNADYAQSLGVWDHSFLLMQSTRPSVQFDYQDINVYNYRTKVATKTLYQPITMTFYEDEDGQVSSFLSQYLKIMSPISNIRPATPEMYDLRVMDFRTDLSASADDIAFSYRAPDNYAVVDTNSSSLGYFESESRNLLNSVSLYHLYKGGGMMDVYTLANPRITTIELSELNMETSAATTATVELDYDAVFVETFAVSGGTVISLNTGNFNDLSTSIDPLKLILPPDAISSSGNGTTEKGIEETITGIIADNSQERSILQTAKDFVFGATGFS